MMPISQLFISILAIISGIVAYGRFKQKVMWRWIVLYWVVLTAKNLADLILAH